MVSDNLVNIDSGDGLSAISRLSIALSIANSLTIVPVRINSVKFKLNYIYYHS